MTSQHGRADAKLVADVDRVLAQSRAVVRFSPKLPQGSSGWFSSARQKS